MNNHSTQNPFGSSASTAPSDLSPNEAVSKAVPFEDDDFSEDLGQRQPEACSLDEGCERCQ